MASHVVIFDPSARRAVIKTSPGKHLSDVLQEACSKLGLDAARHGLKNNNRNLDLFQPFRLSGLSTGAKLQLVVLSRSPSAVAVALQLPDEEIGGSSRLTDKFPSTTTLWLVLRKFESDTGGSGSKRNFTARAVPQVDGGGSGPGRLYYETPVLHIMGRELVEFKDLQKTLAYLGINSGSVLLRLSFRATETPLEEAMVEIDQYFKSVEGENTGEGDASSVGNADSFPKTSQPNFDEDARNQQSPPEPQSPSPSQPASQETPSDPLLPCEPQNKEHEASSEPHTLGPEFTSKSDQIITGPSQRPMTVFAPPSASMPAAARRAHNEKDYEPTIAHAKLHQSRLAIYGRNKTLPSDAEMAAQAEAQARKKADIKGVKVKLRFPDQSTVISEFSQKDTNGTLYEFVRGLMENENEPFSLNFSTPKGPQSVPREGTVELIDGLGIVGGILINVLWEEGVSSKARAGKVLKPEYQKKAAEIEVKEPEGVETAEQENPNAKGKGPEKREGGERKSGVPKWLKLPGKK